MGAMKTLQYYRQVLRREPPEYNGRFPRESANPSPDRGTSIPIPAPKPTQTSLDFKQDQPDDFLPIAETVEVLPMPDTIQYDGEIPGNLKTIDDYFQKYGQLLGSRAGQLLAPIHTPGQDPVSEAMAGLKCKLHSPQAHVATALAKVLQTKSGVLLVGEPGTGKTHIGPAICEAASLHIRRKGDRRNKVRRGRKYRCIVICPDHLIQKWARIVKSSIPGAMCKTFDNWTDFSVFASTSRDFARPHPEMTEYYILGQSQSKFMPNWRHAYIPKKILVQKNNSKTKEMIIAGQCPSCGALARDKDKVIIPYRLIRDTKSRCEEPVVYYIRNADGSHTESARPCNAQLWTYYAKAVGQKSRHRWSDELIHDRAIISRANQIELRDAHRRWAPAMSANRLPYRFDFLIADEVHELMDDGNARSTAFGKLAAMSNKVIGMTGTLINGYPNIFPLLFRISAKSLIERGFDWDEQAKFIRTYGRQETKIQMEVTGGANKKTLGKAGKKSTTKTIPGIVPTLFSHCLIGTTAFLSLEQMSDELPDFHEDVIEVDMDDELQEAYEELSESLRDAIAEMLANGDKSGLGVMVQTLLGWPDRPYDWGMIGYYKRGVDPVTHEQYREWVDLVMSVDLDEETIRPKEQALLDVIIEEKKKGHQVWVFCEMTGKRDVQERLRLMIENELGLSCTILRASVPTKEREQWIADNGPNTDVMISNPELVKTGLDLFDPNGSYNFPTLVFYQTGYKLYTLRQAACRGYRLTQWEPCRVVYLSYRESMQALAMVLMGNKLCAAETIEGDYNPEGLAALSDMVDPASELARMLVDRVQVEGPLWDKVKSTDRTHRVASSDIDSDWVPVRAADQGEDSDIEDVTERFMNFFGLS